MKLMNLAIVASALFVGCGGAREPQVAPAGEERRLKPMR